MAEVFAFRSATTFLKTGCSKNFREQGDLLIISEIKVCERRTKDKQKIVWSGIVYLLRFRKYRHSNFQKTIFIKKV